MLEPFKFYIFSKILKLGPFETIGTGGYEKHVPCILKYNK